ncbi:hypothetical protein M422DRAFT_155323, partial [Sphaerobolus stellatus SS14]
YTATIGVGLGNYTLIVDTGSSDTWIGATNPYLPGPNSKDLGSPIGVSYGSGNFLGEEYTDSVTIGSTIIANQIIGVANQSSGFTGYDGILGLGPDTLTPSTTPGGDVIPTVTDSMASQGLIASALVGVSFVPTISNATQQSGDLHFGQTDPTKFTGNITFTPTTSTYPASAYWGINQTVTYGSSNLPILPLTSGMVDTGTTLTVLATDAFQAYQAATGATLDSATGLLTITDTSNLKSLFFNIGGTNFEFTANAQIWPRQFNSKIGGEEGKTYLVFADIGYPSGQGLDFVNGFTFLQRFYSVYDTHNSQIGFATTPHTMDKTN